MKKYEKDLEPGVSLLYNGSPICWCNKAGKCVEIFKKGYYKVTRVTEKNVYLKVDRKNASHEYVIPRSDIKVIMELELHDLTNVISLVFSPSYSWYLRNDELLREARKINRSKH